MVVKIMHSNSEMVLRTMKNYKAHYSLSWSCPFYKVIAQRPTFLILKINSVTMGVSRELRKFAK
jgi:hypothetical protein